MARGRKTQVFISYSRKDEKLIEPLSKLLRVDGRKVFRDVDCIEPGEQWASEIERALRECDIFVLFWCCHCAESKWVEKELSSILKQKGKRIIPCLLCSRQVPKSIRKFQWINFSKAFVHTCNHALPVNSSGSKPDKPDLIVNLPGSEPDKPGLLVNSSGGEPDKPEVLVPRVGAKRERINFTQGTGWPQRLSDVLTALRLHQAIESAGKNVAFQKMKPPERDAHIMSVSIKEFIDDPSFGIIPDTN